MILTELSSKKLLSRLGNDLFALVVSDLISHTGPPLCYLADGIRCCAIQDLQSLDISNDKIQSIVKEISLAIPKTKVGVVK